MKTKLSHYPQKQFSPTGKALFITSHAPNAIPLRTSPFLISFRCQIRLVSQVPVIALKVSCTILLAVFLNSCAASPRKTYPATEPQFDANISVVDIGGFKLQMTPRAALAVIKAKSYRESSANLETLEDLALNRTIQHAMMNVLEFSYGESIDDRLLRENGSFNLEFEKGRLEGITYKLSNTTKDKLKRIRELNDEPFHFATERETKTLDGPRKGIMISWKYNPNKLAFFRVDYVEREPLFAKHQLGNPGIGSCDYTISVFDANPNLMR